MSDHVVANMAPTTWIDKAVEHIHEVLRAKNADYSAEENTFENFIEMAKAADVEVRQTFRLMLAQKLTREKNVATREARNEPRLDTVRDIAGYAILWLAWEMKERDTPGPETG